MATYRSTKQDWRISVVECMKELRLDRIEILELCVQLLVLGVVQGCRWQRSEIQQIRVRTNFLWHFDILERHGKNIFNADPAISDNSDEVLLHQITEDRDHEVNVTRFCIISFGE